MSNENDYYISDEELAKRLGTNKHSVQWMIKKYKDELTTFGEIGEKYIKGDNGRPNKYQMLNEEQYYLLVFYAKNTEKSVKLKAEVVKEMFMLRDKLLAGD